MVSSRVTFNADATSIIEATEDLDLAIATYGKIITSEIVQAGKQILQGVFAEAVQKANSAGGFPIEFQNHVMQSLENIEIEESTGFGSALVSFDFDSLGDWDDLVRAFHQGAKTVEGDVIWGEYQGETLKNPVDIRYGIWYSLDEGKWEATKDKRIEIWGNKAPEWLYVQFGQEDWEPIIPPQAVIEEFTTRFFDAAQAIVRSYIATALDTVNAYTSGRVGVLPPGVAFSTHGNIYVKPVYLRGKLTVGRLIKGVQELGPSGKPRQAGQFYPLD